MNAIAVAPAGSALRGAVGELRAAGVPTPELDAGLLLAEALGVERATLIADPDRPLGESQLRRFEELLARRRAREPVAYILGRKAFRHIDLSVDQRVLIPRPETELLVELALELPPGARVADVGTGSGAVALALAHERPDLELIATDRDAGALAVARANAGRLGIALELVEADLLVGVAGPFDAVLCNPPYVTEHEWPQLVPEIVRYEPPQALLGGPDGLDVIRRLVSGAAAASARTLAIEVGQGQADAVAALMRAAGFARAERHRDLAGIERVVVGRAGPA